MGYEHQHSEDKHESFDVIIELEDDVDGEEGKIKHKNRTYTPSETSQFWVTTRRSDNKDEKSEDRQSRSLSGHTLLPLQLVNYSMA